MEYLFGNPDEEEPNIAFSILQSILKVRKFYPNSDTVEFREQKTCRSKYSTFRWHDHDPRFQVPPPPGIKAYGCHEEGVRGDCGSARIYTDE